ncbi:unnamed protein product [Prorocentrum cordatum]|uniref:Uncharacterized protein n=1 Tax=Prorocentrum cordatum TaxID=2364126 RepID=A0ABN9UM95_9DINO|nr:unnamed protein product [Polarella glacialis]
MNLLSMQKEKETSALNIAKKNSKTCANSPVSIPSVVDSELGNRYHQCDHRGQQRESHTPQLTKTSLPRHSAEQNNVHKRHRDLIGILQLVRRRLEGTETDRY